MTHLILTAYKSKIKQANLLCQVGYTLLLQYLLRYFRGGNNATQYEEDSVVLTGVKHMQDHEEEAKSAFCVLRLAPPVTTQV